VLACSPGFGWFAAPDGFSTGSSLLPQKRNPDLFELARGKSARLLANAQRLSILLKGLPSAYQKDLQEDKEVVFDTADQLEMLLEALPPAIAALVPNREKLAASLTPDLLAVELADALVAEGVAFRDAHRVVGQLWAAAEHSKMLPAELPLETRLAIHPLFDDAHVGTLSFEAALARRSHAPGAGAGSVAEQLAHAESRLGLGPGEALVEQRLAATAELPSAARARAAHTAVDAEGGVRRDDGIVVRRARIDDVAGIAAVMARYVEQDVLLPRPVSELFQCIREFHVADAGGEIVACAALRLLWSDLGEVRSLAVRPDAHGKGLGQSLVEQVVADAKSLGLPRVIALTREVEFFERCGFTIEQREALPRKVWTDCVKCPRRHACDEVAVVLDLVPGGGVDASRGARPSYTLPIPHEASEPALPVLKS
jgi:argininosuccinate lyase/amino-acid N-acetyltransferase